MPPAPEPAACPNCGRCPRCGKRVRTEHTYCKACRAYYRDAKRLKDRVKYLRNLCSQGCGRPRFGDSDKCRECREKAAAYMVAYFAKAHPGATP